MSAPDRRMARAAVPAWAVITLLLLLSGKLQDTPVVLWPSLSAVLLAFITREIYSSLFLGALGGAILLHGGNLATAISFGWVELFSDHMLGALTSRWNISILMFTLMMGGLVEVLNKNGSMQALVARLLRSEPTPRRAGLSAFWMGFLVFFDGLANSMLVGKTMRAAADRARLSREKLAFIVDSTSSPIASVALVSTWIVTEMSLVQEGLQNLDDPAAVTTTSYGLLLQSLPYRFYALFLLAIVLLTIWLERDIGPMKAAEQKARQEPDTRLASAPESSPGDDHGSIGRVWLAIVPIVTLVSGVFGGLYYQGGGFENHFSLSNTIEALGRAQADIVFVCACATASMIAVASSQLARSTASSANQPVRAYLDGMSQMFLPTLILVFAWTLNSVIQKLGTASYLVQAIDGSFPPFLLPTAVFLLAALISFSTGTSWGTMAIVIPLAVPLAVELAPAAHGVLLPATIGAVLAGSVFGDHCSPISDTTIVSAFASGCDAMDHVRTQLPYAVLAASLAIVMGYLPAAIGVTPWLLLPLGVLGCWAAIRFFGQSTARVRLS